MVIVPRLPKEVVGLPESDFVVVRLNENGVFSQEQKEEFADGVDEQIAAALGDKLDYTFLQISKWGTTNLVRLKSRKDLDQVITILEGVLKDTPEMKYRIQPWNPSELPIPNPPQLQIQLTGGTPAEQAATGAEVRDWLEGTNLYPRVYSDVSLNPGAQVLVWRPRPELVTPLGDQVFMNAIRFLNLSTGERTVADWASGKEIHPVQMGVNKSILTSVADLRAIPLRIGDRIVPLSALGNVDLEAAPAPIFAVNGEQTISIYARQPKGQEALGRALVPQAEKDFQRFRRDRDSGSADSVRVEFVEAEKELSAAISEITQALGWSLGLIGLILLLQFGKIGEVFLVLVAVPLGVVGSFLSLWIFGSTLSLNSVLGIIMMNGLAVGNSIILVDFMNRLSEQGLPPLEAAVQAARTRLRPILITSLTTILGMTPIALGFGEGGKILQPLGISVAGGLWFSMVLTLFLVPALHVCLLQWRENRRQRKRPPMSGIGQSAVNHFLFALVLFPCAALMVTGVAKAAVASTGDRDKLLVWMRSAIDASPEARVRLAEQEVSRLRRDGVGGVWKDFLPSLGADGQLVRRRESSAPLPVVSPRGAGGSTVAGVGISARSNLFAGGRDQALRDEAEAALETDQAGVLSSRLAAAERLGGLVLDYLELRQREAALADRAELLQRTHKVASLRFAKAQIARSDVARVLRQMELAQGEAEDLDLALAAIRRQITIASPLLFPESVEVLVPIELLPDSPAALKQGEQHPEVVALVAQQRALAARRSAINSGSFPTIDGVLAANTSYPLDPSGASEEYGSSAALELTWTFYDKGKRSNESAALLAQERVVEEQIKRLETKQGTARDVAVSGLKRSLARHKRSLTLIETAQDALQAQQERFSQGRVSLFELLSDTLEVWKLEDGRREQNTAAQRAWLAFCRSAALELDTCIKVGK
jgi:outer membrane protein TolC/preprotein translocase subunit SecF